VVVGTKTNVYKVTTRNVCSLKYSCNITLGRHQGTWTLGRPRRRL